MKNDDLEFITNLGKILSFVDLKKIYESWESDGSITQKTDLLAISYVSLLSHPAIFLTKENANEELEAAKICHEIWLKYDRKAIEDKINGKDEELAAATKLTVLPPYMYLLYKIDRFFLLHYLLIGMFEHKTDKELSQIDGDLFAKTWLSLLEKGYQDEKTEKAMWADNDHRVYSWRIILKLKLSEKYINELDEESVKVKMKNYYETYNSGNGCMVTLLMALGSLSSIVTCIGLLWGIF